MNIRATKKRKFIAITGQKDPRGPDNTIEVWICEQGKLHIKVEKPTLRCYEFEQMIQHTDGFEIIQK